MAFDTISQLLKKDAGLCVKKHALRLLHLLLNCKFALIYQFIFHEKLHNLLLISIF